MGARATRMAGTAAALVGAVMLATGCASAAGTEPTGEVGGELTVFAAASLTEPFTAIGEQFEADHPGTTVVFNFAGSSTLAQQLNEGAPADVFASANPANMQLVADADPGRVDPVMFARNQLVIAVPAGNPFGIESLTDLTAPGLKVAICAEQVPCGAAAAAALAAGEIALTPTTLERDVRATLSKLTLGEVDAALVYRTDVRAAADQLEGIEFPESDAAINDYPISVLADAPNLATAEAFVDYVRSAEGAAVLREAGFQEP